MFLDLPWTRYDIVFLQTSFDNYLNLKSPKTWLCHSAGVCAGRGRDESKEGCEEPRGSGAASALRRLTHWGAVSQKPDTDFPAHTAKHRFCSWPQLLQVLAIIISLNFDVPGDGGSLEIGVRWRDNELGHFMPDAKQTPHTPRRGMNSPRREFQSLVFTRSCQVWNLRPLRSWADPSYSCSTSLISSACSSSPAVPSARSVGHGKCPS